METGGGREVASVGWMRVLLVERHPELRRVLGELLASEGLGVYPVDSPAAAAAALARGVHVDVVLVDEDTAPYEVMRLRDGARPAVPVVVGTYGPRHYPGADAEAQKARIGELVSKLRGASADARERQ